MPDYNDSIGSGQRIWPGVSGGQYDPSYGMSALQFANIPPTGPSPVLANVEIRVNQTQVRIGCQQYTFGRTGLDNDVLVQSSAGVARLTDDEWTRVLNALNAV